MTLDEAREHVGEAVVYDPGYGGTREDGVIVRADNQLVFVRYGLHDSSIKATFAGDLTLFSEAAP